MTQKVDLFGNTAEANMEVAATWETHVLIPLVQNLLGGIAVFAFSSICIYAVSLTFDLVLDWRFMLVICSLLGGAFATFWTIVRFYGDDWGILATAYKAGKNSQQDRITAQAQEIHYLNSVIDKMRNGQSVTRGYSNHVTDQMDRAWKHANVLLEMIFARKEIAREKVCKPKSGKAVMGERDWERAMRLLKSAGCIEDRKVQQRSLADAKTQIKGYYLPMLKQAESTDKFRPGWF